MRDREKNPHALLPSSVRKEVSWGPVGDDFLPNINLTYLAVKFNIKTYSLEAELMSAQKRNLIIIATFICQYACVLI